MAPRIHVLGLPHTITSDRFSTCAFTSKVRMLPPMLRPLGYEVTHYGNGGSQSGADEEVVIIPEDEFWAVLGTTYDDPTKTIGEYAIIGSPIYRLFTHRLAKALHARVRPGDLVFHTFGKATEPVVGTHAGVDVESGIGYPESFLNFRIFESAAWMHWHQAKRGRGPSFYEFVIPAAFDVAEWPAGTPDRARPYVAFLGRIGDLKGCNLISQVAAKVPECRFILCGQGDATPYLTTPNVEYLAPIYGRERAAFLGGATALMYPSQFLEPFGQTHVEAMLCGTPVVVPPYGVYLETVTHGRNGYRCRVLADWVRAVREAGRLDRAAIRRDAVARYALDVVGQQYDMAIRQISAYARGDCWDTFAGSFSGQ